MATVASLMAEIGLDQGPLTRGLGEADSKIHGFASGMTHALGIGAIAAGTAFAGGIAIGIKSAGDLEQAVANVGTIKPEIDTSAVFSSLSEMTTRVPQSAKQLGDSLYDVFSSVDVTQAEGLALVEKFAKGAVGASTDAQTFGTAAMGVMNAYGLSVSDADHISDVFFNTVKLGVVTGDELANNLGLVTQSAKMAGVPLDTLGGFIAGVTKEGGPAAQNINNLNNFLLKVTTADAQKALHQMGVATVDATGHFRAMPDVLTDLKGHLSTLTEAEKTAALQQIFPDLQARAGATVLLSQLDFVKGAINENETSAGAASAAYARMSATFNSQSQLLMNSMLAIVTTIGAQILPSITPLVTAFAQSLPAAMEAAKPALAAIGAVIVLVAGVIRDAFQTVVQVFQQDWAPDGEQINPFVNAIGIATIFIRDQLIPAVSAMIGWFQDHTEVIVGFAAAFAAFAIIATVIAVVAGLVAAIGFLISPIGLVVLAIGLLTAAWVGNWGDIQGKTAAVVSFITGIPDTFGGIWDAITGALGSFVQGFQDGWQGMADWLQTTSDGIATFLNDSWNGILTTIAGILTPIVDAVTTAWNTVSDVTDTVHRAIQNILIAIWDAIYDNVIKPKLDAISEFISTTWTAVSTATSNVLGAVLTFIRDNIFEPIRAAVDEKLTLAKNLAEAAWIFVRDRTTAVLNETKTFITDSIFEPIRSTIESKMALVKSLAEAAWIFVRDRATEVLNPVLVYIRDTIFNPIKTTIEGAMTGATTAFTNAVTGFKTTVDTTLGSVKSVWETTWSAIKTAAESPKAAMDVLIGLVGKLDSIMPAWLIPHSPTPFQIGLEGIAKAAQRMGNAFSGLGGGMDLIERIAGLATGIGGADFGRAAAAISASETGGGQNLTEIGGTGAVGPFQFDPGGQLQNFARYLRVSMQDAARVAITDPMQAASWALKGYLGDALRDGLAAGLRGRDLAIYASKWGQRPAEGNELAAGDWFTRLFPGFAKGGIVWEPQLAMVAENGPEAIIPLSRMGRQEQGGNTTININAPVYGVDHLQDVILNALDSASRRGRISTTFLNAGAR